MNSFAFLDKAARQYPDIAALVHGEERISYSQFRARALSLGGNLRSLGCAPGDRVAFCLSNSPRILEVIFGCFAAGLVVVPINARLHSRETAYIVENSGARVFVHGAEYQDGILEHSQLFRGLQTRVCMEPAEGALDYQVLLDVENALSAAV